MQRKQFPATGVSHPLAEVLTVKMEQHQQSNFVGKQGVTSHVAVAAGDSPEQLIIHTCAEKMDPQNQASGHWRVTWAAGNTNMDSGSTDISR